MLAVVPSLFPSTIICVAKPLQRLHRAGRIDLHLTLEFLASRRQVEHADVVVICHSIDPRFAGLLTWLRDCRTPLIYDLDDNLLDVPSDIPGMGYLREPARRDLLVAFLRQADVVRVYSPGLQTVVSAVAPTVELVSGPLDWSLVPGGTPARLPGRVRLVYATSRRQDRIGQMILGPLREALDACPEAELTIWGPRLEPLAGHPRVRSRPFVRDYDRFFSRFASEGFDIGLAPLPDDAFHRGKSNLKFREYAACGVAGIYSDTPVYSSSVIDGETGLLVGDDGKAWKAAIRRLIADRALRERIAGQARDYARRHFGEAITDRDWMTQISALITKPGAPRVARAPRRPSPSAWLAAAAAVARQAAWLGRKAVSVQRSHGTSAVVARAGAQAGALAELLRWRLHERRVAARTR